MSGLDKRLYELEYAAGLRPQESFSVVCYFWKKDIYSDARGFEPSQVNALAASVNEHFSYDHRFICITDETDGFSDDVELMPLPDEAREIADVPTAQGHKRFPSCYRRLWTFSESATVLGDVVLLLDVDCFIIRSIDPLFEFQPWSDFVGWNPVQSWGKTKIGGGTWRLRTGTKTSIWNNFSVKDTIRIKRLGFNGSDQALLSYYLADEAVFPEYWILNRQDMRRLQGNPHPLSRIVHCNGPQYMKTCSNIEDVPWVR